MGPCLCGDIYCGSCGPAQGNFHCMNCGKWTADGGCEDPEYCANQMRLADEMWAAQEREWAEQERKWAEQANKCVNEWGTLNDY